MSPTFNLTSYFAWHRLRGDHADGMYEILTLEVGSVDYRNFNILYFPFKLLLSQMYDLTTMFFTVPMWGSEVATSKAEIHLTNTASEVTWACDC